MDTFLQRAYSVWDPEQQKMLEFIDLIKSKNQNVWTTSLANELGRLAQGIRNIPGTNTIKFIHKNQVPHNRKVTYAQLVVDYRPGKSDPNRTRLTVGGNLLTYEGDLYTETTDIITTKLLLNSVLSTKDARFMTIDIKNFYLETPMDQLMDQFEYIKIKYDILPPETISKYNLQQLKCDDYIYIEIQKGMYGLKQAEVLANKHLEELLKKDGYAKTQYTPGLWKHKTRPIMFNLCVDDFGIKYVGQQRADHLISSLRKHYEDLTINWKGDKHCGMGLK